MKHRQESHSEKSLPEVEHIDDNLSEKAKISIALENELRDIQSELEQAEESEITDLKIKEESVLKAISQRAKAMEKDVAQREQEIDLKSEFDEAKSKLRAIFNSSNDSSERLAIILDKMKNGRIEKAVLTGVITRDESDLLFNELKKRLIDVTLENDFVQTVMEIITPIEWRLSQPENIRKMFVSKFQQVRPDGLISYGFDNDESHSMMHLHLAYARDFSGVKIALTVKRDLEQLAKIVAQDKGIQTISGTSYVVAANYGFFRKFGFDIKAVPPELREKYFQNEERPILEATIGRDEFLANTLK